MDTEQKKRIEKGAMLKVIIAEMQKPYFSIDNILNTVRHSLQRPEIPKGEVSSYINRIVTDIKEGRQRFHEFEYIEQEQRIQHKPLWYMQTQQKHRHRMRPVTYRFESVPDVRQEETISNFN